MRCLHVLTFFYHPPFLPHPQLHEQGEPPAVTRMDRYQQLTQYAFGKKWGECRGLAEVEKNRGEGCDCVSSRASSPLFFFFSGFWTLTPFQLILFTG